MYVFESSLKVPLDETLPTSVFSVRQGELLGALMSIEDSIDR